MKDTGFIRDKDNLPITGFSYSMQDEAQKAKIKLGPLTCLPKEHKDRVLDLKVPLFSSKIFNLIHKN